jgi:hypothetical protein
MSNVFNVGGVEVAHLSGAGTVTLDGVGDVVRVVPTSTSAIKANEVRCPPNAATFIRVAFDATTIDVSGSCYVVRGTVS